VRKRTAAELMPPPPPAKKIRRPKIVLNEDSYIEGLSHIITRDFFPALLEIPTQHEYLDALASKDPRWISSAGRRLKAARTPWREARTPKGAPTPGPAHGGAATTPSARGMDTPASIRTTASSVLSSQERLTIDTNSSLTTFQTKYTSEDNESFYKLLDRQNQRRVEKFAWVWNGNKLPSKQMIAQRMVEEKLSQTRSLIDDGFKRDRLAIKDRDGRPAQPDSWKSTGPKSSLMFIPDGIEDRMETRAQQLQMQSRMEPKEIVYSNTRAPDPNRPEEAPPARPGSPTMSEVRLAATGTVPQRFAASSIIVSGDETPRVNGYAFVDDEDDDDAAGPPPIIDLGPGDGTPSPFRIAASRKREALHHRMVDRIVQSKKTESRNGITGNTAATPDMRIPSTSGVRGVSVGSLTPAAQRLWSKLSTPVRNTPMGTGMGIFDSPRTSTPRFTRGLGGKQAK